MKNVLAHIYTCLHQSLNVAINFQRSTLVLLTYWTRVRTLLEPWHRSKSAQKLNSSHKNSY